MKIYPRLLIFELSDCTLRIFRGYHFSIFKYCYFWTDILGFLTRTFKLAPPPPPPPPRMFSYGVPPWEYEFVAVFQNSHWSQKVPDEKELSTRNSCQHLVLRVYSLKFVITVAHTYILYICSRPGQRIKPAQRWFKPGQRCKNLKPDQQLLNQGSRPPFHHICISGLISRTTLKPEHICAMLISCLGQFGHGRHFRCPIRLQVYFIINLERGIWRVEDLFSALIMPVLVYDW